MSRVCDWRTLRLWPHQREAIDKMRSYFLQYTAMDSAALTKMPTGTGKSGVIAVLSTCFEDTPHVLVITPFAALRDQLVSAIDTRFWAKIGTERPEEPVKSFVPSEAAQVLNDTPEKAVYVCTIQALHALYVDATLRDTFDELKRRVSLVIFDEGHRQPATKWAAAIRDLAKPTVLMTATPYRNDHKFLAAHKDFAHILPYFEALTGKFVRAVHFVEVAFENDAAEFVEKLLQFYDGEFRTYPCAASSHRVIVRCDTKASVDNVNALLRAKGLKTVAIHDDFTTDEEEAHRRTVPPIDGTDAVFWVHQNKLIEGIDDSSFVLLAIFEPLRNARSVVQQIGRIVRNPDQTQADIAYVFCHPLHRQQEFWNNYLNYERQPCPRALEDFLDELQAEYQYFEGNYQQTFKLDSPDAYKNLNYRLSANIYQVPATFSMSALITHLKEDWADLNRIHLNMTTTEAGSTAVCVYSSYGNSPVLREHVYLEFTLGYTIIRKVGSLVFFYDSQGATPEYLRKTGSRVNPSRLRPLFSPDDRISQVSLMNSDLGNQSIRRRTLGAFSMVNTAPSLSDHANVCSTVSGSVLTQNNGRIRRYVGFSRARVSDTVKSDCTYSEFITWVDDLAKQLTASGKSHNRFFDRFTAISEPPSDPTPINILLDLDEACELFQTVSGGKWLEVEDLCVKVERGRFLLVANSKQYVVEVSYDKAAKSYSLECEALEHVYRQAYAGRQRRESLVSYLNKHQCFRIVPKEDGYVYSHGHFSVSKLGLASELALEQILVPVKELLRTKKEKGGDNSAGQQGWDPDSVFGVIDRLGKGTDLEQELDGVDLLVCDDLCSEIADFIGVDTKRSRVIFFHAKTGKGKRLSASALADVCAQAVKNLDYLQPNPATIPSQNLTRWEGPWTHSDIGNVPKRIRHGSVTAQQLWNTVVDILRKPEASREVWIVMGDGLSARKFKAKRNADKRPAQVVQIYYQLAATWSAVSSVGAKLRVCCVP